MKTSIKNKEYKSKLLDSCNMDNLLTNIIISGGLCIKLSLTAVF